MKQLHPRAVWLFFISFVLRWAVVFAFLWLFSYLSFFGGSATGFNFLPQAFFYVFLYPWALLIIFLALSYLWARLSYHFYRYELREDGFRKELGVIYKKYVTIPYERIQNVDIYRGILARILGLSDLNIQTAGMSSIGPRGGAGAFAEGRLPGLSRADAEQIRDELIRRARASRGGGV